MYLISSRKDFWSCDELSDRDEVRDCVLSEPDPELDTPVSKDELVNAVSGKRMLLLIHGYNNDQDDVNRAYHLIQQRPEIDSYDTILGYTWPGGNMALEYLAARNRGKASAPRLAAWLQLLASNAKDLDIMCHSLGNFVALRALSYLVSSPPKLRFGWMTAAAVHDESIEPSREFSAATAMFQQFCVYHSRRDAVLMGAFPLAEGDIALGLTGPEDKSAIEHQAPQVRVVNCKRVIGSHSGYKRCDAFFGDLERRITGASLPQFTTL